MATPSEAAVCRLCQSTYSSVTIKKRLIICCDGTFYAVDKGTNTAASNVARMCRVISRVGVTEDGEKVPQIVHYQSGVGTGFTGVINKSFQGAFGGSLNEKVCEAYNFLATNWSPGDEIVLIGFSRGAYTARSLAGFICQVGLLPPYMMDYFDEIYDAYKARKPQQTFEDSDWANEPNKPGELGLWPKYDGPPLTKLEHIRDSAHTHVKIKAVGVWDTVGSLGMSGWVDQPGSDLHFHSTKLHPKIENAFQALALDESRGNFPPTLWYLDKACRDAGVNLAQCWFPGYHSDVGGYNEGQLDKSSVDETAFAWMCDKLHKHLQLSGNALQPAILFRIGESAYTNQQAKTKRDTKQTSNKTIVWSDGELEDNNSWTSIWWLASAISTRRGSYVRRPGETNANERDGTPVHHSHFHEEIHPCVQHRIDHAKPKYQSKSLSQPAWSRVEKASGNGFEWVKKDDKEKVIVTLKEHVIPKIEPFHPGSGCDHWQGSLERAIAPRDYLQVLDKGNGI